MLIYTYVYEKFTKNIIRFARCCSPTRRQGAKQDGRRPVT